MMWLNNWHLIFTITIIFHFTIAFFYGQMFSQLWQWALDAETESLGKSSAYLLEAHCRNSRSAQSNTVQHKSLTQLEKDKSKIFH